MSMTYFTISPSVSNAYIEQLNAGWEIETWTRDFNLTEGSRQSQKNPFNSINMVINGQNYRIFSTIFSLFEVKLAPNILNWCLIALFHIYAFVLARNRHFLMVKMPTVTNT